MLFKESAYVENRKYYEGVDDTLVREYHDILNSLEEEDLGNFAPSEVVSYLYRRLETIPSGERISFLSSFFDNSLKNDIRTVKVWVSYLDTHMEERYVEDGEMMIEYRSSIEDIPLAIRGDERYEVIVFIENILKNFGLEIINIEYLEQVKINLSVKKENFKRKN